MYYLKIFLTHLDFRLRLTEIRTNFFSSSLEKYINVVDINDSKIGLKKEIRHGKYTRTWTKKV